MKKMKVIQSNEKETEPGQFITKVQDAQIIEDPMLGKKEVKATYYFKGTVQHEVGKELSIELSRYRIAEHEMMNPATQEKFQAKWLHAKAL